MSKEIKHIVAMGFICIFMITILIAQIHQQDKQYESIKNLITVLKTEINKLQVEVDELRIEIEEMELNEVIDEDEETEQPEYDIINYDVPSNNTIKSYMDYRKITSTDSRQYKLQHTLATTDNHGLRIVNGRYCVALGSYYTTTIGQYVDIELENGAIIYGILADCKDDKHTDDTNRINPNGSVVEFVVDVKLLDSTAKTTGDISCINGWDSKVVNIKVYDKIENF